jgi:hypothetical protein
MALQSVSLSSALFRRHKCLRSSGPGSSEDRTSGNIGTTFPSPLSEEGLGNYGKSGRWCLGSKRSGMIYLMSRFVFHLLGVLKSLDLVK